MKILLSAYACEPDKGSEPGVGWHWALALERRGYGVHVITRSNNREAIERAQIRSDSRLQFHYYDFPSWARFWKYWPGGIYVYYLLWQIGAYQVAKKLHARERFDLIQHITFVSYRQPSFMGGLGIPFIFGPVGGGEAMPKQFRITLPLSARLMESMRSTGNSLVALDPLMRHTFSRAQVIACATEETLEAIPRRFQSKCIVQRAIGLETSQIGKALLSPSADERGRGKRQFLFVGRLLYWKGLHLVLRALADVRRVVPDVSLRVIGEGSERSWLEEVARDAEVTDLVEWIPSRPHAEMSREYQSSIGFVFPSLHDSGGMVVLEALAAGLPVICLDLGGPGSIVTPECGLSLEARNVSESQVIDQLATALIRMATDAGLRERLSAGAVERAKELTWDAAAEAIYARDRMRANTEETRLDKRLSMS